MASIRLAQRAMPRDSSFAAIRSYIDSFSLHLPSTLEQWHATFIDKNVQGIDGKHIGRSEDVLILESTGKPQYVVITCRPKFWSVNEKRCFYPILQLAGWDDDYIWIRDRRESLLVHIDYNPDYVSLREQAPLLSLKELHRRMRKRLGEDQASESELLADEFATPALWRAMYW